MNLHKCSFAPAVPLSVDQDAFTRLWEPLAYDWRNPWNGGTVRIFDDRHADRIPDGAATLALALTPSDRGHQVRRRAPTRRAARRRARAASPRRLDRFDRFDRPDSASTRCRLSDRVDHRCWGPPGGAPGPGADRHRDAHDAGRGAGGTHRRCPRPSDEESRDRHEHH